MRVVIYAKLQALDQQLSALAKTRDSVAEQLREGDALRELEKRHREYIAQLKREREQATDLHWELEETEARLRELEEQNGEGPSDPLVARELAMLRNRRSQLEEQALIQMERVDEVAREVDSATSAWQQASQSWLEREMALREEWERLRAAIEALHAERARIAASLSKSATALYDDLQRRHRGTAIAAIRNRQCAACRARLSGAVFDLLSDPDSLVRCPRCGRVLAHPDHEINEPPRSSPDVGPDGVS